MLPELPKLEIIPVAKLLIHERHDHERTLPLIQRMRSSGVFRNPPVVTPIPDSGNGYLVLDGANRTVAVREMGFEHVLVQVIEAHDPGLQLFQWNHVIWEANTDQFFERLKALNGVNWHPFTDPIPMISIKEPGGIVAVKFPHHTGLVAEMRSGDLAARLEALHAIVDTYFQRGRLDRTGSTSTETLQGIYPHLAGLVIFPRLELEHILQIALGGQVLPSGITRFTISPRALHLNYPLEELNRSDPLARKNEAFQKWLRDLINHKRVRYYSESTFLYDE